MLAAGHVVTQRATDGSPAVRLGDGWAAALLSALDRRRRHGELSGGTSGGRGY
jgi:hypothetical protein